MSGLGELDVLVLDCQASGATPAHGDVLELGWAVCRPSSPAGPARACWVVPRTTRPVRRPVRELTGWSEACLETALDEAAAWSALRGDARRVAVADAAPTVIHFARFEVAFLRDLHARLGGGEPFPFDAICLHAVAARLFPDLPRRNIRALAGFLGHSPELVRRSAGHVDATAFIWRAIVPRLAERGVASWADLKAWLDEPAPAVRRERRAFPLPVGTRRALPDRPGVYRFLRVSGDVLYVGKATSLRKRVASHFKGRGPATERGLELLSQVQGLIHTETESLLEAALLEADEIKRLDPPYNVQLRHTDRWAWFASRDLDDAAPGADPSHPIGPLPSEHAVWPLGAIVRLATGEDAARLRAGALAVPMRFLPGDELFREGWERFAAEWLDRPERDVLLRVRKASRAIWELRGRTEPDAPAEDAAPDVWDVARVRRRLERSLVQAGLVARRAAALRLLADSAVAFREPGSASTRALVVRGGRIAERRDLERVAAVRDLVVARPGALAERRRVFDAATYDRMRVLLTELHRILDQGGDVAVRVGAHVAEGERLAALARAV